MPTPLKVLTGNRGKRPLPKGEPQPLATLPAPPAALAGEALAEWQRLAGELHRIGVLTYVDQTVLAAYCQVYERWVSAEQAIRAEGAVVISPNGYNMPHPQNTLANQALSTMLKYMIELGLTPASRVKLAKGEVHIDDPLEQFLTGGKRRKQP